MKSLMVCLVGLLVSVQASPVSPPMVSGHVRLSDGLPVAGAQVVLFDVADLSREAVGQATTDEAGKFALPLAVGGALVLPQGFALGFRMQPGTFILLAYLSGLLVEVAKRWVFHSIRGTM